MSPATETAPVRSPEPRIVAKPILWIVLGVAALSVFVFTEIPLLFDSSTLFHTYRLQLVADRFLLLPHALCGVIALLSGPPQFSTRLRRRHLRLHRILGRVYVGAVFTAATLALIISQGGPFTVATWVQASCWIVCTLLAFLTARNRHIVQHRQWMIRSYAVTFTFISVRIPNPWPAYYNLSDATNSVIIIVVTFLSVVLPDIAFNWREITTRRA